MKGIHSLRGDPFLAPMMDIITFLTTIYSYSAGAGKTRRAARSRM